MLPVLEPKFYRLKLAGWYRTSFEKYKQENQDQGCRLAISTLIEFRRPSIRGLWWCISAAL
jgi:hypothetical protein